MKRCKDCKWLHYENFESNVGYRCLYKNDIPRWHRITMFDCNDYSRKWWKFGRLK